MIDNKEHVKKVIANNYVACKRWKEKVRNLPFGEERSWALRVALACNRDAVMLRRHFKV